MTAFLSSLLIRDLPFRAVWLGCAVSFLGVALVSGFGDLPPEVTTLVDCRRPHDAEIFEVLEHPAPAGEDYPGTVGMEAWATQACYQRFEAFVGVEYERSLLEIGSIRPPRENWEQGPYRAVHCYVYVPGRQMSGGMGGAQL